MGFLGETISVGKFDGENNSVSDMGRKKYSVCSLGLKKYCFCRNSAWLRSEKKYFDCEKNHSPPLS